MNSSFTDDNTVDRTGNSRTVSYLAPTGWFLTGLLKLQPGYVVGTWKGIGPIGIQYEHAFDKEPEIFTRRPGNYGTWDSINMANEWHLFWSYLLIKGVILMNLIWWIPFSWLVYRLCERFHVSTKYFLIGVTLLTVVLRLYLEFLFFLN